MSLSCTSATTPDVRLIGKGVYGTVYFVDNYVLKVAMDADSERAKHIMLWNILDSNCKKYFPKPLTLPKNCKATKPAYSMHAMEYIHGVNMYDFAKYNIAIGNKESIKHVMKELKQAIMCLWKSGFIHNDLHMKNVIVTTSNSIKIIDFGLSENVTPLKTPKTKKELTKWFSEKYTKSLNKHGFNKMNPNLYAYGIKKHKMYATKNQKLYNEMHKIVKSASIK